LLRRVQKRWPRHPIPARFSAEQYATNTERLSVQRGLAVASVDDLMWEAQHFPSWYRERAGVVSFKALRIQDLDAYFEMRAPGLRRKSRKHVAQRLRSLMRYLHRTRRTAVDLAPQIIALMLYAYKLTRNVFMYASGAPGFISFPR
jgi:integrase/recombinase XerD